jgi:hypothetical protein
MQMAATSFTEMKAKIALLEAQLQQATSVREPPKSTAHDKQPQPFRGHGATMHLGSWIFSLQTYLEATNADPSRWVALGSTYLAESAAVWYEHRMSDMHTTGIVDTWENILPGLGHHFPAYNSTCNGQRQIAQFVSA